MILQQYMEGLPDPVKTIQKLDEYVIGQDAAKKNLGVLLLVRALMRLQKNGRISQDISIQKTNLLLIGPTGCGKTQLMRALSEIADIPILIKDVTGITSSGYIGGKVEDILIEYINLVDEYTKYSYQNVNDAILEASDNAAKTELKQSVLLDNLETGIIYLDEVDKIVSRGTSDGIDVTGDMVQNELLKILEGEIVSLDSSKHPFPKCNLRELNTKYISFVCGGAFSGLTDIIHHRLSKTSGIGFGTHILYSKENNISGLLSNMKTEDLLKYGFKAEFLGRLALRSYLDELTLPVMTQIITEPKNAIYKRYQGFFKLFDIELSISKKGIQEIAQQALDLKMGARSLHQIFNNLFINDLVNIMALKNTTLHISKSNIIERLK